MIADSRPHPELKPLGAILAGLVVALLVAACSTAPAEPTAIPTADVVIPGVTDTRPIVSVPDGGMGTIDNWEVTASFDETVSSGYAKRNASFKVNITWTGASDPGEMMAANWLQSRMAFFSPSGRGASVHLRRLEGDPAYNWIAYNGSESLPDEAGTFFMTFAPHPYKHILVWQVDLPYQDQ